MCKSCFCYGDATFVFYKDVELKSGGGGEEVQQIILTLIFFLRKEGKKIDFVITSLGHGGSDVT